MKRISRGALSAMAVTVVLGLLAAWQATSRVKLSVQALPLQQAGASSATPLGGVQSSRTMARQDYAEIDQRPLFVSTRRPPPPPPQQQVPAEIAPRTLEQYSVIGIVAAPARATAIIRGPTGALAHLRIGQAIEGWTLETIEPKKIIFVSGQQHQDLEFKTGKLHEDPNGRRTNRGMILPRPTIAPDAAGSSSR